MNIILAESDEITDKQIRLIDYRAEHIIKVLRSQVGDMVRFGIISGGRGQAEIIDLKKKYPFFVDLSIEISDLQVTVPPVDLILALPRPIMLKRILSQVTALGVGTIHLVNANRVEKSFWEASIVAENRFRPYLLQGLEQAVDTRLPRISLHRRFKPFIEDFFPTIKDRCQVSIIAHPGSQSTLQQNVERESGRVALAVGPEGGWVDYEVGKFREQGFIDCSIGKRILKVDTAVTALHARISLLLE
ncbi:MAG: 16S rRNA (uracil(1498)-N(3))-methyltransferase [Deltaproteobacteria bacterium]|nr:16S rRNA (uracil(1498)-N(3))-methyltransferase [Deltaproteobacteria bacterium]